LLRRFRRTRRPSPSKARYRSVGTDRAAAAGDQRPDGAATCAAPTGGGGLHLPAEGGGAVADAAVAVRRLADGAPPAPALVVGRHLGRCWRHCRLTPKPTATLTGGCRWTRRSAGCTSTARRPRGLCRARRRTQGALRNDKNPGLRGDEPDDHAIGRSRGGLTTKTHALVDGKGRLLTCIVSPGQAGDSPVLPALLGELKVRRHGPGRPRSRPDALRGDKAYSSRGTASCCARAASRRSSPSPLTRSPTASARGQAADAHRCSTPRTTRAATSSSASSTA
jgi:hypothetical protein